MRSSLVPSAPQRLRHWAIAGVAAIVAAVWVVMTLVVPSQADNNADPQPVGQSFNVTLTGGTREGSASFPLLPGRLREEAGYFELRDVQAGGITHLQRTLH